VTTSATADSKVRVAWTAPDDRGDALTAYSIQIESSAPGSYVTDPPDCDGSEPAVLAGAFCEIPLATLRDPAFTGLSQGDLLVAKVTATNAYGTSPESEPNTAGALIEAVPHAPAAPSRGGLTDEVQLQVVLTALEGSATGGSPLLSYVVLRADGVGAAFVPIVGAATPSLATTVLDTSGISSGVLYRYKYFGRNAHGDGPESAETSVRAATVPSPMNPPAVSLVSAHSSLQYRVTVVAPAAGGAGLTIDAYEVLFRASDGTYGAVAECDGASSDFAANLRCDVDLASLTAAPFSLALADEVVAKARAVNELGPGPYSADSSGGGAIVTLPASPAEGPTRHDPGCTETQITIHLPTLSGGAATGGLPLLAYELEWGQGGGAFVAITGQPPLSTSYVVSGLTTGQSYSFRFKARNEVGSSTEYSPVLATYAALPPSQVAAPATAVVGNDVEISWSAPASTGGLPVTAYQVSIRAQSGLYVAAPAACEVATTSCSLPLLTLQAAPYALELGDLVQATVRASNALGDASDSSPNTAGAYIETAPRAPPVAPMRNALTGTASITVDYHPLTGTARGGAAILSYELQWDQGPGVGAWVELVGYASDSLLAVYTVADPADPSYVVSGQVYNFRYRAKNRQGWGAFSTATGIMAAAAPGQLSPVATSMNGARVKLSWSTTDQPAYSDGGQPITGYEVLILSAAGGVAFEPAGVDCASDAQMLANKFCEVPMSVLTALSGPFALPLGQLLQAKVAARNSVGLGPYSALNTAGVPAQSAPL
jgi:hypothetical protein